MGRVLWPVKWLLAPAVAGLLGYGFVGPRLAGRQKAIVKAVQDHVGEIAPAISPKSVSSEETPPPEKAPAPQVSVGVKPVDESAPASEDAPKPRHRKRRRPRPADDEAPPEATVAPERSGPDPASTPG